ncbi:MAG TPA: AAA family ATPase [Bryobacteraceae bacterium]|nr:AAA family ATPase [Bryobacteraceae bacterium]
MRARGPQIRALMVSPDRRIADEFLESLGRGRGFEIVGDLRAYPKAANLDTRNRQLRPDVMLLDVATDLDAASDLIRAVTSQKPPVHVIGLHSQNNSEAILRSLRNGASEFLFAPFDISVQEAAIARIQKLLQPTADREAGKVVVFCSAKPGSGASTLAMQTAYALRRASGKRVLLADFDLMAGSLGFYLNLDHAHSLVDLIQRSDRLDDVDLWSSVTVDHEGIDVLAAPELPFTDSVEQGGLHRVVEHARNSYEWTVIDLPSIFQRLSLLTLSEADKAFLVSTAELSSLHLTRKAVRLVTQLGLDSQKIQVLVNRIEKRTDLNASDLSKLFDCQVDTSLPSDSLVLQRGLTRGQPLDADSELGRAIDNLAGKLLGAVAPLSKPQGRLAVRPLLSHT